MGDWSFEESGKVGTALANYALTNGTAMKYLLPGANTKAGSLARLDFLPNFDSELILLSLSTAAGVGEVIDVGLGTMPAHIIIENLLTMQWSTLDARHNYLFPLALPAGHTLFGRNQVTSAGPSIWGPWTDVRVFSRGLASCPIAGSIVRSYGVVTSAATKGTTIDPGAVANVKSAWTQLGILTERGIYINVGGYSAASRTDAPVWLLDIGVGAAGGEVVLLPNLPFAYFPNPRVIHQVYGPFPINLPTGTRIAARLQCDSNRSGDRALDVAAYITS